eukprot:3895381-Heterocapsa_arctica.AAC.1
MRVLRRLAGKTRHQPLDNETDENVLNCLGCNSTAADKTAHAHRDLVCHDPRPRSPASAARFP